MLRWIPFGVAVAIVRALLLLMPQRLTRFADINLQLAFPNLGSNQRRKIIGGMWLSLARLIATAARFPRMKRENIQRWIRYDGFEHFEAARARGSGVLFATGHLGNWELSAFAHGLMSRPMGIVVRPLDNPRLDEFVTRMRSLSGNRVLDRRGFIRPLLQMLKENEAAGILVDQNVLLNEGIFVPFFGVPACVDATFAKLAARTGATVIPGFAVWDDAERRYILKFYPPVPITGDTVADTARIHAALEAAIREHPEQWLWIHRRWKTRPPGEPALY